jgi:cytochrome c peroxidase
MKFAKIFVIGFLVFCASCASEPEKPATPAVQPPAAAAPGPLGEMAVPADNPITPEKIELGKKLFFDKRLSKTGMMSCESCHVPEMGWTDGKVLSPRFDGSMNTRHSPTLYNAGYYKQWYWDGRAATLEGQITAAWRGQMGGDPEQMAKMLSEIEAYRAEFEKAMGGPPSAENIPKAIAAFVRTITSENAAWDRYERGDKTAVSEDAIRGFQVFSQSDKANCTLCHLPPLYTDTLFHNVGVGYDKPMPDLGRGRILADAAKQKGTTDPEADKLAGAFKTPTLRSVTETGPYFHDGSAGTLEQALDFMLKGGIKNPNLDEKLQARKITGEERKQLLAFLTALTPEKKPFERPKLP